MPSTRRDFLTTSVSLAAGAAAVSVGSQLGLSQNAPEPQVWEIPELKAPDSTREGDMLYRQLGRTGAKVSIIGLGGFHLGGILFPNDATKLLRRAVDNGITFMDNCWDYHDGESEKRMGIALKDGYRQKVFLMTKIDGRTKDAAAKQIDESLKRLQTDAVDLLQIHENIRMDDSDRVFAQGGAMEAILAAKQAGKLRFIGFTGHKDPSIHLKMLDVAKKNNFHFDTAQMPINVLDAHFHSFARGVAPRLIQEGTALLGMKPMADGAILRTNTASATQCLHYAMSMPTSVVITGMDSEKILDQALNAVKTFKPYDQQQLADLLAKTKTAALTGKSEAFKTSQKYDTTAKNPKWLG